VPFADYYELGEPVDGAAADDLGARANGDMVDTRFLNGGERMTGAHEAGAALPPAAALDEDKGEETW
jgi:hypothetical protein